MASSTQWKQLRAHCISQWWKLYMYIISIQGTLQTFRFLVQWVNKNILVRYICTFNGLWQYTRRDIIQSTQSRNSWSKTMIHFLVFFVDRHKVHSQVHRVNLLPLVKCFIVFLLSILCDNIRAIFDQRCGQRWPRFTSCSCWCSTTSASPLHRLGEPRHLRIFCCKNIILRVEQIQITN